MAVEARQRAVLPVLAVAGALGNVDLTHVLRETLERLAAANALLSGDRLGAVLAAVGHALDVVAHVVQRDLSSAGVELGALPRAKGVGQGRAEVIVSQVTEAKLGLKLLLALVVLAVEHLVQLLDSQLVVLGAVAGHGLLDGRKVLPVVGDGLDDGARRVVRPKGAGEQLVHVSDHSAGVRAAEERPGRLVRCAVALGEGEVDLLSEAHHVSQGLVEREVLQGLRVEGIDGGALAPVSVLEDDGSALSVLRVDASQRLVHRVRLVAVGSALAGRAEDDGGTRTRVVLVVDPVALLEGADLGLVVVDQLLEPAKRDRAGRALGVQAVAVGVGGDGLLAGHGGALAETNGAVGVDLDGERGGRGGAGESERRHERGDHLSLCVRVRVLMSCRKEEGARGSGLPLHIRRAYFSAAPKVPVQKSQHGAAVPPARLSSVRLVAPMLKYYAWQQGGAERPGCPTRQVR